MKPVPGTRAELTPVPDHYRIDINTAPPVVLEGSWRLKIGGLVAQPSMFTLDQLRSYEPLHQFITLSCISNLVGGDLIGTTRWTGVSLKRLLPELKLLPNATHLKIRSADGFYEVVALDTIHADDRAMLAYAWDGVPLTVKHGFPLRIYIPDRYGMKQPKWIESIDAIDRWEPGYWVARDWDREARMKATSVIDTIAVDMMIGQAGQGTRLPIGGIAHAGVRGISKVEVRVDEGEWQAAQLRTPLSGQTWVIWRYEWPMQKGKHSFTVRCFDGAGVAQIVEEAPTASQRRHRVEYTVRDALRWQSSLGRQRIEPRSGPARGTRYTRCLLHAGIRPGEPILSTPGAPELPGLSFEAHCARMEACLQDVYGIRVVTRPISDQLKGDLDGLEIHIDDDQPPEQRLFLLAHLFGHTVQWNTDPRVFRNRDAGAWPRR